MSDDHESQRDRFVEATRTPGDNGETAFRAKLATVVQRKACDESGSIGLEAPPITALPARRAKGALSASDWSVSRIGMRDKAQRVRENKRRATKSVTKPNAPGSWR